MGLKVVSIRVVGDGASVKSGFGASVVSLRSVGVGANVVSSRVVGEGA